MLKDEEDIPARAVVGAADQGQLALSGGDARLRDAHRVDARRLFAEERARGADHAVHDRNVTGEKVGQLRQEQRRAQIAHQPLVEERAALRHFAHAGEDRGVGRDIALAAGGGDDHVGGIEEIGLARDAGVAQRQSRGIDADALPRLHLPLIALLRDLLVEIYRRQRMHDVGRETFVVIGRRIAALQMAPVRLEPFAKAGDETDAGDPHLAASTHLMNSLTGTPICSAHCNIAWRNSGLGKAMTR